MPQRILYSSLKTATRKLQEGGLHRGLSGGHQRPEVTKNDLVDLSIWGQVKFWLPILQAGSGISTDCYSKYNLGVGVRSHGGPEANRHLSRGHKLTAV